MALSSVRGARATQKQTRGHPFRRTSLSCSVERRLPPSVRATPSDPRRPDPVSQLQDANNGDPSASVLSKKLLDDASRTGNPYDSTLAMGEEANERSPFGEVGEDSESNVLVVKKPSRRSESGRASRGKMVEQSTMTNALLNRRSRNQRERDLLVEEKPKVLVVKRPVMKSKEEQETDTDALRGSAGSDIVEADEGIDEEAAWQLEGLKAKRDGNVLVVRPTFEVSQAKNEEASLTSDPMIERSLNVSDMRLDSETREAVGRWWEDDVTVKKIEELEELKKLENQRDQMEPMTLGQQEAPKVIERPRPSMKPTSMGRPKKVNETSILAEKSRVFVGKRQTPNQPMVTNKNAEDGNDRSNGQDAEEMKRRMSHADDKPKVIKRPHPKLVTRSPMNQQLTSDAILELRERVLVAKRPTPKLVTVPNHPSEFSEFDVSKEAMSMPVGDVSLSLDAFGEVTSLGEEVPMKKLKDNFQQLENKDNQDMSSIDSIPQPETSGTSSELADLNEKATDFDPEDRDPGVPSLTTPPTRTNIQPSNNEAGNSSTAGKEASHEPMLQEEEEGMRIRAALLKDIQQKRQRNEDIPAEKTDTVKTADSSEASDATSTDSQSAIVPEDPLSQATDKTLDVDDLSPSANDEAMRIRASLLKEVIKDNEADINNPLPVSNEQPSDVPTAMQPQSTTTPIGAAMDETTDVTADTTTGEAPMNLTSDPLHAEEKNEGTSTDASNLTKGGVLYPVSAEADKKAAPGNTAQLPMLKLQGPPKKPEAPSQEPQSSIRSKPNLSKMITKRTDSVMSLRQSMPTQASSNMSSPRGTTKQEIKSSEPVQSTSPERQPTDTKTSTRSNPFKARIPEKPRPVLKAAPVLVQKPSKGEHSQADNIELDRQLMKEKEKTKQKEIRERVEGERKKAMEWRQKKVIETRQRGSKRSDPMLIGSRRKARLERQQRRFDAQEDAEGETIIEVGSEGLSVEELGSLLAMDPTEVMKVLFVKGVMVTVNQTLDMDSVKVVAAEVGVDVVDKDEVSPMAAKKDAFIEDADAVQRPPVVTVMGHVDHGKTTLLDYIRQTRVALGEAGGITQAIGAYTCTVEVEGNERTICFLDTPGHEAFSAMRARGTRVTDIAVIIVAANDGMRPQTREAINHAKAAEVPIVVAINKIDVPGADPERVKRELSEIEMLPEEWGGKTPVVTISAKTGEGVDALLEMLTLVADIQLNLKANSEAAAKGTVLEAYLDKRSGTMATVLVQNGTLHVGDAIVAGAAFGKVRSLTDATGNHVASAGPSIAVQLLGFHDLPSAGDIFAVCEDEAQAKEEAEQAAEELRRRHLAEAAGGGSMVTLSSLASVDDDAVVLQRINLILKADTVGSLEAARGALAKLPQDSVMIRYLHAAAGEVTESDVLLAAAAEGVILGFNGSINEAIKAVAKQQNVEIRSYAVIYDLIDDVRNIMEGKLQPAEDRLAIGQAEVRAVFGTGSQKVAGCMVTEGRLEKECFIRIIRKKTVQFEGTLNSLRRLKDKVETVEAGLECGVGCDAYSEWQEGDQIEVFTLVQKRATLEETHAVTAVDQTQLQQMVVSSDDA